VEATHALVLFNYNLTRKLAGNLAVEMDKEDSYSSGMNFDTLIDDILTGKTQQNAELDTVVRKLLTPTATAYYNTIKPGSAGGAGGTGSTGGDMITNLLNQLLGGGIGSGGQTVELQELPGNFAITVTLGYKPELILAEQARKGLDYNAKIEKVEVAG